MAQGCRLGWCSEVGSFLGYTGRAADIVATTAHDPGCVKLHNVRNC
jgi:hypothetical protein